MLKAAKVLDLPVFTTEQNPKGGCGVTAVVCLKALTSYLWQLLDQLSSRLQVSSRNYHLS